MKNYPRHRANTQRDIFKDSYDDILKCAKRKHKDEFFLFYTDGWWSECSVDVYNDAVERWKKTNGRWQQL